MNTKKQDEVETSDKWDAEEKRDRSRSKKSKKRKNKRKGKVNNG